MRRRGSNLLVFMLLHSLVCCCIQHKSYTSKNINLEDRIKLLVYYADKANKAEEKIKIYEGKWICCKWQRRRKNYSLKCLFKIFPDDFETLFKIYGCYDKNFVYSKNPWGSFCPNGQAKPHRKDLSFTFIPVEELREIIPIEILYAKIISLGIGGCWDGGAIDGFQQIVCDFVFQRMVLAVSILENKTNDEITSFFYFLFDGPHPDHPFIKRTYEVLYEQLQVINPRIAELLKKAYTQLLSEEHCEGH